MTVSSSYTDKVYSINGSTTTFAWGQDLDTQYGSLVVTEETASTGGTVVTTYVEGTDYEVVNKDVVFYTAPSDTTHYIHITRNTYKGQPVEFIEGEDFPAEDYEHSLDRLAMIAQEQAKGLEDETAARIAADTALDDKITAEINRAKGVEGNLSNLTTTAKNNLVGAINEVDGNVDTINGTLATFGDIVTHDVDEFATAAQGAKADNALPNTTKYGASVALSLNPTTYVLTVQLKDRNGSNLGTAATVDLPLESVIVSGTYDSDTQSIILTLDSGDTITIPVGDLVSGLQTEITSSNKLSADLVDDSTSTNKFVTASDKTAWNGKQNALTAGSGISIVDNVISANAKGSLYIEGTFAFEANADTAYLVVTSSVESLVGYYPVAYIPSNRKKKISADASYVMYTDGTRQIWLKRDSTDVASTLSVNAKICLIPTDYVYPEETTVEIKGITNGQYVTENSSRYINKTSIASSVDNTSTNSEVVGAKLFYDTCGDIETLINAI